MQIRKYNLVLPFLFIGLPVTYKGYGLLNSFVHLDFINYYRT